MQKYFYNRGQGLIGIIIVLVMVGIISGGVYYYLQKQIPEIPKVIEKPAEEVVDIKEEVLRKEEVISSEKKVLPKKVIPSKDKPELKITARPAEFSHQNSLPISISSLFSPEALAQITDQLQVEVRIQPSKEILFSQTWTVGYTIKNITDSSFVLMYDIAPDSYKTSGAVVIDPDGNGPMKYFYYNFGEQVSLPPKTEQFFDISLSPPKGLSEITPKIIFDGFSAKEPVFVRDTIFEGEGFSDKKTVFVHDFTVRVTYVPPPAECETPICPEGEILYWNSGVDDYNKCLSLRCVSLKTTCSMMGPSGCYEYPGVCPNSNDLVDSGGNVFTIVDKCPTALPPTGSSASTAGKLIECATIGPKGNCLKIITGENYCSTWYKSQSFGEGWRIADKCP